MKKLISLLLVLAMALSLAACGGKTEAPAAADGGLDGEIAIFWYTFGDTYLSSVRAAMNEALTAAGLQYHDYDANGSQTTQTEQIQTAITKGAAVLVVNIVDASSDDATQAIIDLAKNADLPLVFFNRSVSEALVSAYAKAAYVGTDYTQAGHMEGKMVGEYVLANYDAVDLNGDGEISYVMFKGQEGNMEADARTQYGVEDADAVLTGAGKPALKFYDDKNSAKYLVDQNGAWSAAQGQEYMQTILSSYNEANGNMVELVIANNDDMALGAIAALQAAGYNKNDGGVTIPVFGVDATAAAQDAIAAKSMTGTIKQDAVGMANAVVQIAENLGTGKGTFDNVVGDLEGTWRVNIPYSAYSG
ncbi:MAG: galactose ABC transporter substrate-binding protein [Oscillospiraceae bacterium]|nr:galactose ABC transporter substrate-binding protein [Oscillospiraceae bacterium]MBR3973383.1 galactose ABC transporter substrate-binding protein [Oscillospiraceae bacterium]